MPADAVGLTSSSGVQALSPEGVLPICHGLQVLRVEAGAVAAQVIDVEPIGDRADPKDVRDTVDPVQSAAKAHPPIAGVLLGPSPEPAAGLRHLAAPKHPPGDLVIGQV
jgi:hypothetical protein